MKWPLKEKINKKSGGGIFVLMATSVESDIKKRFVSHLKIYVTICIIFCVFKTFELIKRTVNLIWNLFSIKTKEQKVKQMKSTQNNNNNNIKMFIGNWSWSKNIFAVTQNHLKNQIQRLTKNYVRFAKILNGVMVIVVGNG